MPLLFKSIKKNSQIKIINNTMLKLKLMKGTYNLIICQKENINISHVWINACWLWYQKISIRIWK